MPLAPRTKRALIVALLLAATVGGITWRLVSTAPPSGRPQIAPEALARLLGATLTDSNGQPQALGQWQGKVLVVNYWATWCPPCREEMPAFSRLQTRLGPEGVQFVGIGIDSPSAIKEYAFQTPMRYPLLIGGTEGMDLLRELGNESGALPYTLVLDRQGQPAFSRLGIVAENELEARLRPLIEP